MIEDAARQRAVGSIDLLGGTESFCVLLASHAGAAFVRDAAKAEIRRNPRLDDDGKPNREGPLHLTSVDASFGEVLGSVVTTAQGTYEGAVRERGFTVRTVERLLHGDNRSPLCRGQVVVESDSRKLTERLEAAGIKGALCRAAEEQFPPAATPLAIPVGYMDLAVGERGVTGIGAINGLVVTGPGIITMDTRAIHPVEYSAEVPESIDPPDSLSPIDFPGGERPLSFEWSVNIGEVGSPTSERTNVDFALGDELGAFVRFLTLTVTDARGVRHSITREITLNVGVFEQPPTLPRAAAMRS